MNDKLKKSLKLLDTALQNGDATKVVEEIDKNNAKPFRRLFLLKNRVCLICGSLLQKQVYLTALSIMDGAVCTNTYCNNFTIINENEELIEVESIEISNIVPTIDQMTKNMIQSALFQTKGNRGDTAKILGITERTLYRKIKEFGLGKTK